MYANLPPLQAQRPLGTMFIIDSLNHRLRLIECYKDLTR